jgi:hypothetical protein
MEPEFAARRKSAAASRPRAADFGGINKDEIIAGDVRLGGG